MFRKFMFSSLLCALCLFVSGCMHAFVTGGGNKDEDSGTSSTYFGSFFDFWWGDSPEEAMLKYIDGQPDRKKSQPLYQVVYTTNYGYSFLSIVSLGLFVPVDVRWYMTAPKAEEYQGPVRKKKKGNS